MKKPIARSIACLSLAAAIALSGLASAQKPASASVSLGAGALQSDPILGDPLVIEGEVVPNELIQRQLVTGPLGTKALDNKRLRIWIEDEIGQRIAATKGDPNGKASKEEIAAAIQAIAASNADLQAKLEDVRAQVASQFPDGGATLEDFMVVDDALFEGMYVADLFTKVFLPANPYEYPESTQIALREMTKQAAQATPPEQVGVPAPEPVAPVDFVQQLRDSWDMRQQDIQNGEAPAADAQSDAFMNKVLQGFVLNYLTKISTIETPATGLPSHLALRMNGVEVPVADLWNAIKSKVSSVEVEDAKLWILNTTLAKRALKDYWLDDASFEQAYAAHSDPYKGTVFSIEGIALTIKKFPSIDDYKLYYRMLCSYKKKIADEITMQALLDHGQVRAFKIAGMATADVDVILLSAYDFAKQAWKKDGWKSAEARAIAATKELESGVSFDQALEKYSEFYDPPVPPDQREKMASQFKNKGRFRGAMRNELLRKLDESEFSIFLTGSSIADYAFFDQEIGKTEQPIVGPYGYYIVRLLNRTSMGRPLSLNDPNHREMLENDYVSTRLVKFVQELVDKASFSGV